MSRPRVSRTVAGTRCAPARLAVRVPRVLSTLAARGRGTGLIDVSLVQLSTGERETVQDGGEMCAVVLSGAVGVTIGGTEFGTATRDGDVFESAGDAVYVPPTQALELVARRDAVVAVAAAPLADRRAGAPRLIAPSQQGRRAPGTGHGARRIRTNLGPPEHARRRV